MTQQNAALVEEASAASETMTEQAKNMMDLVGFFQMGSVTGATALARVQTQTTNVAAPPQPAPIAAQATRPVISDDDDDWQEF